MYQSISAWSLLEDITSVKQLPKPQKKSNSQSLVHPILHFPSRKYKQPHLIKNKNSSLIALNKRQLVEIRQSQKKIQQRVNSRQAERRDETEKMEKIRPQHFKAFIPSRRMKPLFARKQTAMVYRFCNREQINSFL